MFPHTRKPLTGRDCGELQSLRGEGSNRSAEGKQRDSHTEDWCQTALTSLRCFSAHPPGQAGSGSRSSGFGGQTTGRGLGLAAWRQSEGASAPQLARRESRKKPGPAGEARDHCLKVHEEGGKPTIGGPCSMHPQRAGHRLCKLQRQVWAVAVISDHKGWHHYCCRCHQRSCVKVQVIAHTFPGASTAHHCQGSPNMGPTFPGECRACLRLLQLHAGLCLSRRSPHIPTVTAVSIPIPSLSEKVSPNQQLLSPPLAWAERRHLRVAHMQRQGQKQTWKPGAVRPKKRKANLSMQLQEQQIKSPQLAW